jgi:N-terminal domain of cytochrome oxidase-cbb3, FixP
MSETHGGTHGEEEVHVYETSGIEEGNKPVPKWLYFVMAILLVFAVTYISRYLTGVQANSVQLRHHAPEGSPGTP